MSKDLNGTQEEEETDDYLLELMGLKSDFPDEALAAYGKIYSRYWMPLLKIAKKFIKDEDEACDLVADTFNKIYDRADSYKKGKVRKTENIRLTALSWMTTIMKNEFYDLYLDDSAKENSKTPLSESYIIENITISKHLDTAHDDLIDLLEIEETSTDIVEDTSIENLVENSNVRKVEEYINKQTERDQDIIRTTYNFFIKGKNTPTDILNYLENRWGTRRENIRKILEKFRKAIKNDLQENIILRK